MLSIPNMNVVISALFNIIKSISQNFTEPPTKIGTGKLSRFHQVPSGSINLVVPGLQTDS